MRAPRALLAALSATTLLAAGAVTATAAPTSVDLGFSADVPGTIADKDGTGTGFTAVVANAAGDQYQPAKIDVQTGPGTLTLTGMAGSNTTANSLKNHLDVTFDATSTRVIGARLVGPLTGINTASKQGGVVLGPSQDDYIKLVATATSSSRFIQFYREINGSSRAQIATKTFTTTEWANIQTLDLFMRVEPATGVVTAEYSVNGGAREPINTSGGAEAAYTIPSGSLSNFVGANAHAGILAFTGSAAETPVVYDWFRIGECVATGGNPSIASVSPADGATGVARDTAVTTELNVPNCGGVAEETLTTSTARLIDTTTGNAVAANVNTTGGGDAIILQPVSALAANRTYRFEVTAGVEDESGASFVPFESTFTTGSGTSGGGNGTFTGGFDKTVTGAPLLAGGAGYTALAKGPDNKLYAATNIGTIYRFPINADGSLGAAETIDTITNDQGGPRIIIGIDFDPAATAANPILWVTHNQFSFTAAQEWTGVLSKLSGPSLGTIQDVLVGLPRSQRDHMSMGIAFNGGKLYISQGSNSAMGAPDNGWGQRPERELTGAVLELDPSKLPGSLPLDVRTPDGGGTYNWRSASAPLTIFGSGVRNAYDVVWHSNGQLYVPTNGSAASSPTPSTTQPLPAACQNRIDDATFGDYTGPVVTGVASNNAQDDYLFRIVKGGYYGHPNPSRCEWVMNGGNPTSGVDVNEVSKYAVGTQPDRNYRGAAFDFGVHYSPNGATEYTNSSTFGGALAGTLLVTRYSAGDDIILLRPNGTNGDIASSQTAVPGLTGLVNPLDIAEDAAKGNLYVAEYPDPSTSTLPSRILLMTPSSSGGGDTTPPTVTAQDPEPGQTGVDAAGNLTITFSEAIDPGTVSASSVTLTGPGGAVAATRTLSAGNTVLTVNPNADLAAGTTYTLGVTSAIEDVAGNAVNASSWTFTTAEESGNGAYQFVGSTVAMEAENADEVISRSGDDWTEQNTPAGAVGTVMTALPDNGSQYADIGAAPTTAPELRFRVQFPAAGNYRVSLRGNMPNTNGNSAHVGLNGVIPTTADFFGSSTYNTWVWLNSSGGGPNPATISVPSAGVHTVNVYPREDGISLDRVVISTAGSAAPSGTGPAESPRAGGGGGTPTGPYQSVNGAVTMEAENADELVDRSGTGWDPGLAPAGSVGSALTIPNAGGAWSNLANVPTSAPEIRFQVDFDQAGTYRVWVRSNPLDGGGDSLHAGLNGVVTATSDAINSTNYGNWVWAGYSAGGPNPATITVPSAGVHTVSIYGREDGMSVDRIHMSITGAAPTGNGPAESARS